MKVASAVLLPIACLAHFVSAGPDDDGHNGGDYGGDHDGHDEGNHYGDYNKQDGAAVNATADANVVSPGVQLYSWGKGGGDWYCVRRSHWGNQCIIASCERSPCSHGGSLSGCNKRRRNCQGCSSHQNNHNPYWWRQMHDWCGNQGGYWTNTKYTWRNC